MPYKDLEKQKEAQRNHYERNLDNWTLRRQNRRILFRQIVKEAKNVPCMDCGIKYPPYVMDLDHIGDNKISNLAKIDKFTTEKKLREEISKCEVVCSNCHRERTYSRRSIRA